MDSENPDNRKRRSSVSDGDKKRKKMDLPRISASQPTQQPNKLIDQLFETWKNNEATNSSVPSTPVYFIF